MNNSEDFEFVLQRYADADRKTLRDAFLQDPEGNPDDVRWAAVTLCKETLGFESMTGREFTPDQRDLKPAEYLQKMKKIVVDGTVESLWSPDYKAFQAIPKDDLAARVKYVREKSPDKFSEKAGEWWSEQRNDGMTREDLLLVPDIDEAGRKAQAILSQKRGIIQHMKAQKAILSQKRDIRERIEALEALGDIGAFKGVASFGDTFVELDSVLTEEEVENARKTLEPWRQLARDRKDVADYEAELMRQNAWAVVAQASKGLESVFAEEIVEHALAHKGKLDPERLDKFSLMSLEDQRKAIPMLHALREASDGRSWVGDVAHGFVRSVVETPYKAGNYLFYKGVEAIYQDSELYQIMAEQRALLELANEAPMADWGGLGNAIVGVASTLPYMGYAATGVGSAAIIGSAAQEMEMRIASEGGDVSSFEAQAGALAAGVAYWGIERMQASRLFGPIEKLGTRQAFLTLATHVKNRAGGEILKSSLRVGARVAGQTVGETFEESLQRGLEDGYVALGLGKDAAAAVASGMVQEIGDSGGTMFLMSLIGAGRQAHRYRSGLFNSKEELVSTMLLSQNLANRFAYGDYGKNDLNQFGDELGMLFRGWISDGGNVADFAKRFGLDIDTAILMSHSFEKTYKAIGGDAEEMKTAMGGRNMLSVPEQVSQAMPWMQATRDDNGTIHLTRADGAADVSPQVDLTIRMRPASEFAITDEKLMDDYDGYHISIVQAINAAGGEMTMEKWRGMTLEERRKAVDQYVEADEAKFTVADEDGNEVTEGDLAKLSGTIDLNVEAMPGAQFHEVFHAVVKVLKRSGLLTKEVIDGFKAAFGEPLSEAEEFNEESGANNFQEYIQGKFDPVSKGLFDKFADGVTRLLTFVRGVRKQAEDDLTDYERFVESIRTGNIRQVPVVMAEFGRKVKEAADKAAAEAEADADAAPGEGATPPESRGDEQTPADPGDEPTPAPSPTAAALPSETADRPRNARSGSWSAVTPDGSMRLGGVWGVVDLDGAMTSDMPGYLQELQGRSRDVVASRLQIQRMGRGIDVTRLTDAATTDQGAPILTADFMVLSGNGRILALREAFSLGLFEPYRAMVRQRAAELGIDISGIANPVLVRILPPGMEKEQLVKAAELSNRASILQRGLVETAEADAKILTGSKLIETMDTGESGDLTLASNRMFMNAFIERTGDQSLRLSDGSASPEAYARVRRAALAAVFEGMPEYRSFLRMIFERGSSEDGVGVKRELDGIMKAAPQLVRMAAARPDYAINIQLGQAFSRYMDFRNRGGSPEAIEADIAQQDMFAARDEFNDAILRQIGLRHSSVLIGQLLDDYAARAMAVDPTPDMFGNQPPTALEVFEQAAKSTMPEDLAARQAAEIAALRELADAGAEQAAEFLETPAGERLGELEANVGRASEADEAERQALVGDLRNSVGQARHSIRAREILEAAARREYDAVVAAYTNPDGTRKAGWMLAPNGKPTNLTERQWVQVRTPRFKAWFGDWENDPKNASKVIDENGEPLVVYHSSPENFTIFDITKSRSYTGTPDYDLPGFYFTPREEFSSDYGDNIITAFLNLRNPIKDDLWEYKRSNDLTTWRNTYDNLVKDKYDGYIGEEGANNAEEEYIAFSPNQIKSATGNTGAFDAGDKDIRHSIRSREILEPDNLRQYLESKDVQASQEHLDAVREQIQIMLPFMDGDPLSPASDPKRPATLGAAELSKRKIRAARIMRAIADTNPTEKISKEELNAAFDEGEDVSIILPEFYKPPYNKAWPISGFRIRGPQDIAALSMQLRSPYQEMFKAVYLDKDNVVLDGRVLTVGLVNASLISPHLVFSNMPEGTVSLIIGHNHPSGDPKPSQEDIQVSKIMLKAGRSLGVKVVDHVITDGTMYYSMRNEKLVDFDEPQKPGRRGKRVADWVPQTADWEAFLMIYASSVASPEVAQIVSENLRYVDSENVFVYVMNNKVKLLGVSRIKADQFEARDELGSRNLVKDHAIIAKRVARFGASNSIFVDVPSGFFKNGAEHIDWFSYFSEMLRETGISHVYDVFWKKDGKFWSAQRSEPLPESQPTAFDIAEESWTGAAVRESVVQQARMEASARHSIRARSVTPEQDADYLRATEAGDRGGDNLVELLRKTKKDERDKAVAAWLERNPETAKRLEKMVEDRARAAGYNVGPVWHAADRRKTRFAMFSHFGTEAAARQRADDVGIDAVMHRAWLRSGEYPSAEDTGTHTPIDIAHELWGKEAAIEAFERYLNAIPSDELTKIAVRAGYPRDVASEVTIAELVADADERYERLNRRPSDIVELLGDPREYIDIQAQMDGEAWIRDRALEENIDGLRYRNDIEDRGSVSYVVFDPAAIKSADAVTYDDAGNVIPLSERFNEKSPDTRRRIAPRFDPYDDQQHITGRMLLSSIIATDRVKGIQRDESEYEDLAGSVRVDLAEARKDADAVLASINKRSPSFDEIHAALAAGKADELFKAAGEKAAKLGANAATLAQRGLMDAQRRAVEDADAVLLQDFKNEVGVDPARDLVAVAPASFDPDYKPKPKKSEKSEKSEGEGGAESDADAEAQPTPEQQAMIDAERKRREGVFSILFDMLAAFRADQEVKREKRRREAEERRKLREAQGEKGSADEDEEAEEDEEKFVMPEIDGESAEIKTASEFAYVLKIGVRLWIERREQRRRERSGERAPGKAADVFSDPVNVATYRKSMVAILRDIAKKWVDPNAAVAYNAILKAISEIPSNATVAGIELRTGRIIARIQRNAVRLSRKKLMADIDADIQRLAIHGKKLDELEKDSKRKVKGEHEATARYVKKMLKWSPQRCDAEILRLKKLMNDRTAAYGEDEDSAGLDPATDVEIRRWYGQICAIERWGGMKDLLPGEIMEKGAEIRNWLEKLRLEHQQAMEEKQRFRDEIATLLQNAIKLDPSSMKPKWKLGRKLADEFTATLKQRLEAVMFVKNMNPAEREAATRGIEAVMDLVAKGSETYRVLTHRYRKQFDNAVKNAIQGTGMTFRQFLKLMDEEIPEDLNRKITSQAQGVRMTWGNAAQLYASLRQTETYRKNIKKHKRSEQAEMLKEAMPVQILRFISAMREVYQVRRPELSRVKEVVTGFPVDNPDPLYMPVKIFRDPHGELDNEFRRWFPIPKPFDARVPHNLDFDESAHIMDVAAESMRNTALAVAFGESGLDLRSILARKDTYSAIVRYHGKDAAKRIIEQVTDHLTDGYRQKTGGVDKIVRGVSTLHTYAALSWNASSASKQAFSIPAWAAVLDGGIREMWVNLLRYDKASALELAESPGFLARYRAHSMRELIREAWTDPSKNALHRFYQAGMTPLLACDLWASMRVGVGVYKSRRDALIRQGVADGEARERAARATWALIEEAQQSDRPENTPDLLRRRGFYAKQMYKFQSANVLQFSHEFTALMQWRRAQGSNRASARKKFINAVIANHLLIPIGFSLVSELIGLALSGPPDDEKEWMKEFVGNLLLEMVAGPFGHIVFFGGLMRKLAGTGIQATGLEPKLYGRAMIPSLDMLDRLQQRGLVTMSDIAQADWDAVRDDVLDLLGKVNVPIRYADRMWWTWVEDENEAERRRRMRRVRRAD